MKPKHLPRLWCALHGLLPLEGRRLIPRGVPGEQSSSEDRDEVHGISCWDRQIRAVLSVVSKETKPAAT